MWWVVGRCGGRLVAVSVGVASVAEWGGSDNGLANKLGVLGSFMCQTIMGDRCRH